MLVQIFEKHHIMFDKFSPIQWGSARKFAPRKVKISGKREPDRVRVKCSVFQAVFLALSLWASSDKINSMSSYGFTVTSSTVRSYMYVNQTCISENSNRRWIRRASDIGRSTLLPRACGLIGLRNGKVLVICLFSNTPSIGC